MYNESSRILYTSFLYKKKLYHFVYSKESGQLLKSTKIINDIDGIFGVPSHSSISDNSFLGHFAPSALFDHKPELAEKLKLNYSDNYVLQILHLKKKI